ncbi:MAG: 2,5-didehydrogluconate reductase DkgB [Helicobacteraceae bacterium]|jgi:2,5-diketo-D-gluconate reductase B|nr:2,5-didehydrogluconate reductase DkgB [Helicobacteraceae bacterium]
MSVVPLFGVGTFRLKGEIARQSVSDALSIGYRAVDTAQIYDNEAEVGEAIAQSGVKREEIFLTTKVWITNFSKERFIPSLEESLNKLRSDFVDLALIHWPSPSGVPLRVYIEELIKAKQKGLTRHIGVSNFPNALLKEAIEIAGKGEIACNQVELSPWFQNRAVRRFAIANDVEIVSYMTLSYGKYLNDPVISKIAAARGIDNAGAVIAWAISKAIAVIPSSTSRAHLLSNLKASELRLGAEEIGAIDALERGARECDPEGLAPEWDN